MTSPPANKHVPGVVACALSVALAAASFAAPAQSVIHPTPPERAQHTAHAQQLKSKQQARKLRQRRQQRINDTAAKAYKHHPKVQTQMHHASSVRQRLADKRDRDLDKKVTRAQRPQPTHVEPARATSK